MCIGGGSSYTPPPTPRWLQDTSKEVIKSKYELSDENKELNRKRRLAKVSKGRVSGMTTNNDDPYQSPFDNSGYGSVTTNPNYQAPLNDYSGLAPSQTGMSIEAWGEGANEESSVGIA